MNTLSWLIYWAGVVGSMNGFFVFISVVAAFVSIIAIILTVIGTTCSVDTSSEDTSSEDKAWVAALPMFKRYRNVGLSVFTLSSFLALAIPDKQTIVMIGASEFAQRAVQSEAVQRLTDPSVAYIETWLRNEIEKMTPSSGQSNRR